MKYLRIPAPAKINLILYVLGKRSDGYHDLCSLFHRVSLCDELFIRKKKSPGLKLDVIGADIPSDKLNTITKAYEALSQLTKLKSGLQVKLKKRIPIGSGLGGGSSDAASFLLAVNRLLKLRLSLDQLCRLGGKVGSDVPFFVRDTASSLVEGRGESIELIRCKKHYFFVIVAFNMGLSTSKMYENLDKKHQQPVSLTMVRANVRICAVLLEKSLLNEANSYFHNDFFQIAQKKIKRISQVIRYWKDRNIPCLMSGSGSSVFAVFPSKRVALKEAKRLKKQRDLKVFVAESYIQSIHAG